MSSWDVWKSLETRNLLNYGVQDSQYFDFSHYNGIRIQVETRNSFDFSAQCCFFCNKRRSMKGTKIENNFCCASTRFALKSPQNWSTNFVCHWNRASSSREKCRNGTIVAISKWVAVEQLNLQFPQWFDSTYCVTRDVGCAKSFLRFQLIIFLCLLDCRICVHLIQFVD